MNLVVAHHLASAVAGTPSQRAFPYLTTLVLLPIGAAIVVMCLPHREHTLIRIAGFLGALGTLGLAVAVLDQFSTGVSGFQMQSTHPWFGSIGIAWSLGVDGISLFLVMMTALLFPVALAGGSERANPKAFTAWMLLLEATCLGSFLSLDVMLFFLFFEASLVPTYFLISGWGHEQRGRAATKFFVYTFLGSAFLLVGIVTLAFLHQGQTGVFTFDVRALSRTHLSGTTGVVLFLAFTAAFAVKAPIWPFHTWSPLAYREAPVAGSVILAAVMAKLGTYGVVRFDLGLFPHATVVLAPLLLTLGAVGIIYGAIVAAVQKDLKRLVAFSSLAHLGFIVLGLFALSGQGVSGAVLQMANHGLYTAALFLLIAMIYRRRGTFDLSRLRGLQRAAPMMAAVFILVVLASIGVPGLNGFVGEFLILLGTFLTHRWWAVVGVVGVILAAVYLLWAYQQAFHGPPDPAYEDEPFADLTWREGAVLAPLVVLIVFLGIWPQPVLERITPSVDALVTHVEHAGGAVVPPTGQPVAAGRPAVAARLGGTSAVASAPPRAVSPALVTALVPAPASMSATATASASASVSAQAAHAARVLHSPRAGGTAVVAAVAVAVDPAAASAGRAVRRGARVVRTSHRRAHSSHHARSAR
jgi:NADH-quinone oxidoreductase subunit M